MSDFYQRLSVVNDLNTDAYAAEFLTGEIQKNIESCETAVQSFADSSGVSGALDSAIRQWISDFSAKIADRKAELEENITHEQAARDAMSTARSAFSQLITNQQIEQETRIWSGAETVEINGQTLTGGAYANALRLQRIAEREAAAMEILNTMNSSVKTHQESVAWGADRNVPSPEGRDYGSGMRSPSFGPGGATAGPATSGLGGSSPAMSAGAAGSVDSSAAVNTARLAGASVGGAVLSTRALSTLTPGAAVNWKRPRPGELGSATNPITDPSHLSDIDLLRTPINQRMTPDGPVGGQVPASTTNIDDPSWRDYSRYLSSHVVPSGAQHAASAGLVGGVLGVGGSALALRGLGASSSSGMLMGGTTAMPPVMAGGMAGSPLQTSVARTGMLSTRGSLPLSNTNAGVLGGATGSRAAGATSGRSVGARGAVAASGRTGGMSRTAGGAVGTAGSTRGTASASDKAGGMTRTTSGAVGTAGSRGSSDKRQREERSLVGYDVVRLDEDDATMIDTTLFGEGSVSDLAPISQEESDRW